MSVRLDRLQTALVNVLTPAATDVLWSYTQPPREQVPGDLLALTLTSGPNKGTRFGRYSFVMAPPASVVVRVSAATAGVRNVVKLNGFSYFRDTVGGDTATIIRDALLADILAGELAIAVTADAADGILLTASTLGAIWSLSVFGEMTADAPVFPAAPNELVNIVRNRRDMLVTCGAFSKTREPFNGAWSICDAAMDELETDVGIDELSRHGVALRDVGPVTNVTALAGGHWETRAAFDLDVTMVSTSVRPTQAIETVNFDVDVHRLDQTTFDTASGSATAP